MVVSTLYCCCWLFCLGFLWWVFGCFYNYLNIDLLCQFVIKLMIAKYGCLFFNSSFDVTIKSAMFIKKIFLNVILNTNAEIV